MGKDLIDPELVQYQHETMYTVVVGDGTVSPTIYRYRDAVGAEHLRAMLRRNGREVQVLPPAKP